ncbi:hypothetical protein KC19_VG070700 [Ceratodon purpureus]|uniref:Uncharacterized protein n=1 Tax=Ceratodon purpureus TaxID=3225 RepID=A0A8T0HMS6_CERPU|nr:hypothetical protein KC19_VG070700 [Ceratodon purpureus]
MHSSSSCQSMGDRQRLPSEWFSSGFYSFGTRVATGVVAADLVRRRRPLCEKMRDFGRNLQVEVGVDVSNAVAVNGERGRRDFVELWRSYSQISEICTHPNNPFSCKQQHFSFYYGYWVLCNLWLYVWS